MTICEAIACLLLSGLMGGVCGLFSYLLDYCFWKGNIFQWYLPWLAGVAVKKYKPGAFRSIMNMKDCAGPSSGWRDALISEAEGVAMYKLLGGCAVCLNVHIAVYSWVGFCLITPMAWYYGFPYVLVSSLVIRKLVGAVY